MTRENNVVVKSDFDYDDELAFLEDWLENPKYDKDESGYVKVIITKIEEVTK